MFSLDLLTANCTHKGRLLIAARETGSVSAVPHRRKGAAPSIVRPSRSLKVLRVTENAMIIVRISSDFCIAVAGFRPRSPLCNTIFLPSYSTPTLHVLGRNDIIVVEERSKTLLEVSSNKRVEWHDGGTCGIVLVWHMWLWRFNVLNLPLRTLRPVEGKLA